MATVTWNTSNQSNCNLIFISSLTNNTLSTVPLIPTFPFQFNPLTYGLNSNDIYGTYSFNCQGCLYIRNIQPQFTTTTMYLIRRLSGLVVLRTRPAVTATAKRWGKL